MANPTSPKRIDKTTVCQQVWSKLLPHAIPDSRHSYHFSSFIPDFRGSDAAINRVVSLACYKSAELLFIAPDNCLEGLRLRALQDGKRVLTTTYGIRRGFIILDPRRIGKAQYEIASLLDGMERSGIGRHITLAQMKDLGIRVDMCVTGAGATTTKGRRFGKGHGFFDLEWAMMYGMGIVSEDTPTVAVVHDCQVVDEEKEGMTELGLEPWDVPCDYIATPNRLTEVPSAVKPTEGVHWKRLKEGMMDSIPPLQELKGIQMADEISKTMSTLGSLHDQNQRVPDAHQLMGIEMVEQLMKGYRV